MTRTPYLPLFVADFMGSTATWTGPERGLYLQMLAAEWSSGPLPSDTARLARALNYSEAEFMTLWPTVREKFANGGGTLTNGRLETVRAGVMAFRAERAENAKKAAATRWHKDASSNASGNASSNAKAMQSISNLDPSLTPTVSVLGSTSYPVESSQGRGKPRPPPRKRCPEDFEVTETARAWAALNAPDVDITRELAKFKDWEFKTARSDWGAAWRNWMRKAQESAPAAISSAITWRPPARTDAEEAPEPPP